MKKFLSKILIYELLQTIYNIKRVNVSNQKLDKGRTLLK